MKKLDDIQVEPTAKDVRIVDVDALRKFAVRLNLAANKSILVTTEPKDDNNVD